MTGKRKNQCNNLLQLNYLRDFGLSCNYSWLHGNDTYCRGVEIRKTLHTLQYLQFWPLPRAVYITWNSIHCYTHSNKTNLHTFTYTLTKGARSPRSGWNTISLPREVSHVQVGRAPDAIFHRRRSGHTHPHFHASCEMRGSLQDGQREMALPCVTLRQCLCLWLPRRRKAGLKSLLCYTQWKSLQRWFS